MKSELDNSSSIPVDLAVKYGKEYMGSIVKDKTSSSRQLFYRGITQEINQLSVHPSSSSIIENLKLVNNEEYADFTINQFDILPTSVINQTIGLGSNRLNSAETLPQSEIVGNTYINTNTSYEAINTFLS